MSYYKLNEQLTYQNGFEHGYLQGKTDAIDELYSMLYDKLYEGNIVDNQIMHIIKLYAEQVKGADLKSKSARLNNGNMREGSLWI